MEINKEFEDKTQLIESKNSLHIKIKSLKQFDVNKNKDVKEINLPDLKTSIKSVILTVPYLSNDSRWKEIDVPSSTIFLGSDLINNDFNVKSIKLRLPHINSEKLNLKSDIVSFSLFEDLIDKFIDFLNEFEIGDSILAAGGPFITLNPMEAFQYLEKINIFYRGEGEKKFSRLLKILNKGNLSDIFNLKGIALNFKNLIIFSSYDITNYTFDFSDFKFNLNFLKNDFKTNDLEMNFSRGCKRGCAFCSKVQGKYFRKLPTTKVEELLKEFKAIRDSKEIFTININDDDILQDKEYAKEILETIEKYDFKLWGIQTSIESFFKDLKETDNEIIDIVNKRNLYAMKKPLLWLGTDGFLKERKKVLSKFIPDKNNLIKLVEEFEKKEILNYHYWISSDYNTNWNIFIKELLFIIDLKENFSNFYLLAHSPFIIPYPSTPVFKIIQKKVMNNRIRYKKIYKNNEKIILKLVERLETEYDNLNLLLLNTKDENNKGFFDYIKEYDFLSALKLCYTYLKKDILLYNDNELKETERLLYNKISELI